MTAAYDSDLAKKLNIKRGMTVRVIGQPAGLELPGLSVVDAPAADALLVFVKDIADAEASAPAVVEATAAGRITWMAYPKARQLGTDLNRDILYERMKPRGVAGIRQVAVDATWSAMRFKHAPLAGKKPPG